jgi:hypothetical protein
MWLIYTLGETGTQPSLMSIVTVTKDATAWGTSKLPEVRQKFPNDDWFVYQTKPSDYSGSPFFLILSRTIHPNEVRRVAYYGKWVNET